MDFFFLKREKGEERHGCARDTSVGFLPHALNGDLTPNPGTTCPDRESNLGLFGAQDDTPTNQATRHQAN